MEALSPRDANKKIRNKPAATKSKAPAPAAVAKQASKDKDHPPPPPAEVHEPPSSDRKDGAIYRTGKLLGKGGFAICYEGRLAGTKQLYALKIVKSQMPQKKMEQKFQTELQIHSKMNHPNIVRFQRAFSYNSCTYLVLELCPNGSLMDMVKKRKFITEPEVRFWTVQMAGAIKYMHAKGIIHRDLKMGNVFLDSNMNVKVGDFGLAALLMSGKDWNNCRRTTLCGTPNYIAPEILSKEKGGHDHAVDIWSLGIIIFAMLTGKPPFQSTTADEIYRRAREREYDWPKLNTSENCISQETKDLVSDLLQSPEERPDPDTIVQHPFFTCGWMPQSEEMTPALREALPGPDQFTSAGLKTGRSALHMRNLKKLCLKCDVGNFDTPKIKKLPKSTYRECAAEEQAGLTPVVPLAEGVVYRPFDEWLKEREDAVVEEDEISQVPSVSSNFQPQLPLSMPAPSSSRQPTQSFAAQQRARPGPSNINSTIRAGRVRQPSAEEAKVLPRTRSVQGISTSTRNQKAQQPERISEAVADVGDRLAQDLVQQLNEANLDKQTEKTDTITPSLESIFNPRDKLEEVPNTKPDYVLERLRNLQSELERALNSRSIALETKSSPKSHPDIVVKWVDYTNRYGLGYILSNGSAGCIFKALPAVLNDPSKGYLPPSCMVVRDGERHLHNRTNEAYIDRYEVVPVSGPKIEFYENYGEKGVSICKVSPQQFKVSTPKAGEPIKMKQGVDKWDDRKRELIICWKKFGNYMMQYGRDQDYPSDEALSRKPYENKSDMRASGNVIIFYQRWGDVGCWGFCDGSFQFNFPDHTKIILSADGTWCDFYHLPLEAALDLAVKGTLSAAALDDRQHLSYPVQTLLNFMAKPSRPVKSTTRKRPEIDPMIQGVPQANDFRKKIEFIRSAVKEWVSNGGMGNSNNEPSERLRWTGCRELVTVKVPYKHVWTSVGARNGDDRRVAWFDPRNPHADIPDVVIS